MVFYNMKQNDKKLNSVEKALNILLSFSEDQSTWGVRELSTHLGISPATVQRLLQTLKAYSFVDQNPKTRQYSLGNIYYNFLNTLQTTYPINRAALPFMKYLSSRTQETVHINVIENTERICIDSIEFPQFLKASMPIGNRSPLYAGASSKCLLAFSTEEFIEDYLKNIELKKVTDNTITNIYELKEELSSIRKKGYSSSMGERTPGLGAMSAPVFNHRGMLLACISLAMPEIRFRDDQHYKFCMKELIKASKDCSKTMGYDY